MKKLHEVISHLDTSNEDVDNPKPVFKPALLDLSKASAVYPTALTQDFITSRTVDLPVHGKTQLGGLGTARYDCIAVDIGPSTFYLDVTWDEAIKL